MPTYRLVMRSGPSAGKVFPLDKPEVIVGRDLNNDIVINDPEVSRRHARFFIQGNSYVLEDLGSTNGTFINGQRLSAPYALHIGEAITFGERINLVFDTEDVAEDLTVVNRPPQPMEPRYQSPATRSRSTRPRRLNSRSTQACRLLIPRKPLKGQANRRCSRSRRVHSRGRCPTRRRRPNLPTATRA